MYFQPKDNGLALISWTTADDFSHQIPVAVLLEWVREGQHDRFEILDLIKSHATPLASDTKAAGPGRWFPDDFRALLGSPRLLDEPNQPLGIQLKCLGDEFVYDGEHMGLIPGQNGSVGEVESMALVIGWNQASQTRLNERQSEPGRFIFAHTVCYELGHNGAFLTPPTPVPACRFASATGIKSGPRSLGIGPLWHVSESDDPNPPGDWMIASQLFSADAESPRWESSSTLAAEYYAEGRKSRQAAEYLLTTGASHNTHVRRGAVIALGNAGANNGAAPEQQLSAGDRVKCRIEGLDTLSVGFSLHTPA